MMKSANTKLKSELLGLIDQMETQLVRIQTSRAERFRDKKKALLARQANKDRTYLENTHKITRLKREIDQMYIELEHQYNNEGLVELENKVEEEKKLLRAKHDEAKAMYKLNKNQDKHLIK